MWCRKCNKEAFSEVCDFCGTTTEQDIPTEIYWCKQCRTPIIRFANEFGKTHCPVCGAITSYLSVDLRPVFPEERLLLEILIAKPLAFANNSVWCSDSRYYIDGKPKMLTISVFHKVDVNEVIRKLDKYGEDNRYDQFNIYIERFIKANRERLNYLKDEAFSFIRKAALKFQHENIVVSFSGGKDSTVVSDLVTRALSNPSIVHIFGDTTLEFPLTLEYTELFRLNNRKTIFKIARNKEQDFYNVCEDIGPPARMLRWCCSMFKTGPITRVLNNLYRDKEILTFYGIRKCESVSRSKYNRIEHNAESVKIQKQIVASPIFFWKDIDIWLYLLGEKVDFNEAYRLGYDRVGCWCCPNNNDRAQFLSTIYMPEQSKRWREFLVDFARRIGKQDAEVYIDSGKWKARQGGQGVESADDVKIRFTNCTTEDNAKVYQLNKPISDSFYELFIPFGELSKELGRKILHETIILDNRSHIPILSIEPFSQEGYEYSVKIKTLNVKNHDHLQRMVSYQIRKYNACRKCLKCESLCKYGAISIVGESYRINGSKCKRCKMCVTNKYLEAGCLMEKYLKTKIESGEIR